MCMIDHGDMDPRGFSHTRMVRARRPHRCCECSRTIMPGEVYERTKALYEGRFDTYHACAHCVPAKAWLSDNCGGYVFMGVWEDIAEHVQEYRRLTFPLGRLLVASRRGWQRFDKTGLMAVLPVPPTLEQVGLEDPVPPPLPEGERLAF